jgi:hypothetical protein
MQINVISELERYGIPFKWSEEDEVKCKCPFHNDSDPSCNVNIKKQCFKCFVCKAEGDILKFLSRYMGQERAVLIADLSKRYEVSDDKTISPDTVERYHAQLPLAKPLLAALYERGVTDDLIRYHRLGENDGRITIPIKNLSGAFVNIRRYLPGAPGKDKMRNLKGYGGIRIYPIEQLKYETVVICGGEMKAIVAAKELNQYGIGAFCVTAGEGNWSPEFNKYLKGKRVYVCMDIDVAGQRAANIICLQIRPLATWIGNVLLPLDNDKYKKGDINDYVAKENGKLKPLLDQCNEYVPSITRIEYNNVIEPEKLELSQAIHADKAGKRITVSATVSVMDDAPYVVPKDVEILCNKDQKFCALCPVFVEENTKFTVNPESPALIEFISTPKNGQIEIVKSAVGIPPPCKVCEFQTHSHYNVEDTRISPQLEILETSAGTRAMIPAYCIGRGLELNESYNFTGRMFPHPKTQLATLLISSYETTEDTLSTYKCEGLEELSIFWPDNEWSAEEIGKKLESIYKDFEANVTRIFQRFDLHLAVDLTYHSPLQFLFDGKSCKGWMETLIVGDSGHGKSEVTCGQDGNGGLKKHFGLGARVDCDNASVAGLLGGCQSHGSRYFITWGILPTHDRRLVIMEEIKGLATEAIGKLKDMRSTGTAEIPKIEKRKTKARVRLIMVSNPRSQVKISQYSFAVQAAMELIGSQEDLRRFDFVLIISDKEINPSAINMLQKNRPVVEHVYTSELCRKLILWAWTRKQEDIEFKEDAEQLILQEATKFCSEFTEVIPIVDRGSMRLKIARMSAALAARTFSCSSDFQRLVVHRGHVQYICDTLRRVYGSPTFGYTDYTKAIELTQVILDPDAIKKGINETPYPKDVVQSILATDKLYLQDLQDWCGWDREQAMTLLSLLVRKHAMLRDGRHYRKSAPFISLLRDMLEKNEFIVRPKHIPVF